MSLQERKKTDISKRIIIGVLAALLLAAMAAALVACGDGAGETGDPSGPSDSVGSSGSDPAPPASGDLGTIKIGRIAWDECIATTYLWKHILEQEGYQVEMTQLDAAQVYSGLEACYIDFFTDAWLPTTHEDYWEEYSDSLEDLSTWYDKGTLELTVPSYMTGIDSIADLKDKADMFEGRIVGIEPGAGLTRLTLEAVMPGYGLDDYTLLEGSTPAMLAELKRAIDREQPIVVTLWRPHWVYAAHDLKDLEDPEGLFGEGDKMHVVARQGFSEENATVAEWLSNFKMDDESLASLSQAVIDEYGEGQEEEAVEAWLSEPGNQAMVDEWLGR